MLTLILILTVILKVVDISAPTWVDITIIILAVLNVLLIGYETLLKRRHSK